MNNPQSIEFGISGNVSGKIISATKGVPFSRFMEFNADVQQYLQGSDAKTVLHDLQIQVTEGSYLLRVLIPIGILQTLLTDTEKIAQFHTLGEIDRKRAEVILRWQERARMEESLTYVVHSSSSKFAPITITRQSNFTREDHDQWVRVERYLIGQITDWGGAQAINVHLRPRNSKTEIIITASEDQIREQRENLVFHKAIVRVHAKQNPRSGEMKDYRLLELRAYGPQVEESRLQELFAKGAKAWADVPDSGAWVEDLRGGAHA